MQHELVWAFALIFLLDSIAPGPAVAMVMSRGASIGLVRTLPFIAGLVLGDLMLFVMALFGLVALVKTLGPLFVVVKWVGVAYLLYLAYSMWNADYNESQSPSLAGTGWRSFLVALLLPLGNPKAVGFYVALLPAFMDVSVLTFSAAAKFAVAIVVIWSGVLISYTTLAEFGSRRFRGQSATKWMNRGSASAMAFAAGAVALKS